MGTRSKLNSMFGREGLNIKNPSSQNTERVPSTYLNLIL